LFSGVAVDVDEKRVREQLEPIGPVVEVSIIRDGDPNRPVVLVTMDIDDDLVFRITSRVSHYWHDGNLITARVLPH
jgi:hypothetical protein